MKNQKAILFVLFTGVLMGALDISIVGPAIPSIEKAIHVDQDQIGWVFSIYVLMNLIGISLFARLSDMFGRRMIYTIAVSIFAAGSLWVAFSHDMDMLLIGRAIQGFGASGIFPVASAVVGDIFPPEKRGSMLGLIGAVFGIAFILGPILAGIILTFSTWNMLFLINLPLAAFVIYGSQKYLPHERISEVKTIDYPGIISLGAFLTLFNLGLNFINPRYHLSTSSSRDIILLFSGSLVAFLIFILVERRAKTPVFNLNFLKSTQISVSGLIAIGTGMFQALFIFVPSMAIHWFGVATGKASFMLVPLVIATAIGAPIFGKMLDKFGSKLVVILGMLFMSIGLSVFIFPVNSLTVFYLGGIFMGLSFSILSGSALRYIVLNEVSATDRASSQGIITIFISIGQTVGSVFVGIIIASSAVITTGYQYAFMALTAISLLLLGTAFFLKGKDHVIANLKSN